MPSVSSPHSARPLALPGTEYEATNPYSFGAPCIKHDEAVAAAMLASARCRWLLTLEAPKSAAAMPTTGAVRAELQSITQDDTLHCTLSGDGPLVVSLEGSWNGYLLATKAALKSRLRTVCGQVLMAIEPAFTPEYHKLYFNERTQPIILENFVQVYGPLFLAAVKHARSRYLRYWNVPTAEEILTAVWERCITKLSVLIESYSPTRGKQYSYLFTIAKHAAHDYIRPLINAPEEPVKDADLDPPPSRERLHDLLEKRELLQKLMAAFEQLCAKLSETKKPGDWDFFREHFLHEVSKEEMCQRYGMSSNTFDKRVQRIRERLSGILHSWLNKEP